MSISKLGSSAAALSMYMGIACSETTVKIDSDPQANSPDSRVPDLSPSDALPQDLLVVEDFTPDALSPDILLPDAAIPVLERVNLTRGQAFALLESCIYPPPYSRIIAGPDECMASDLDGENYVQRDAAERLCGEGHIQPKRDQNESFELDRQIISAEIAGVAASIFGVTDTPREGDFWYSAYYRALQNAGLAPLGEEHNPGAPPSRQFLDLISAYCRTQSPCFERTEFAYEDLYRWMVDCRDEFWPIAECEIENDPECCAGDCCAVNSYYSTEEGNHLGEILCRWNVVLPQGSGSYHTNFAPVTSGDLACNVVAILEPTIGPRIVGSEGYPERCYDDLETQIPDFNLPVEERNHPECPPTQAFVDEFLNRCRVEP